MCADGGRPKASTTNSHTPAVAVPAPVDVPKPSSDLPSVTVELINSVRRGGMYTADATALWLARANLTIEWIRDAHPEHAAVRSYFERTQTRTHTSFTLKDIFRIDRIDEQVAFRPWESNTHRRLLWHGSHLLNWKSILKHGIQCPTVDKQQMYGMGLYFTDVMSKAGQHCKCNGDWGILGLVEVALGNSLELPRACHGLQLPQGFDSVTAKGRYGPSQFMAFPFHGAPLVPVDMRGGGPTWSSGPLLYNEYVVYNPRQCRLRYLVRICEDE